MRIFEKFGRVIALLFLTGVFSNNDACTSFVISGKATPDGRPIILKNRDTYDQNNHIELRQGEKYRYIAVIADRDIHVNNVWSGHNEKGFALVETDAYTLNSKDDKTGGKDGEVLRRALEICATLKDFENMLDTLTVPIGCNSDIGVIDADGGAAYYEVGNKGYKKYDANEAPNGYLARTNFAISGDRSEDQGIERYLAISKILDAKYFSRGFIASELITEIPRYPIHGLTGLNYKDFAPEDDSQQRLFPFRDFIPRYLSASTQIIQGVKHGENPLLTVAWTIIGSPLTTVAIPLVITNSGNLPLLTIPNKENASKLTQVGLHLKQRLFPASRGNGHDYIDLAQLTNKTGTGILQKILPIEKEIIKRGNVLIDESRNKGKWDDKQFTEYYHWVDTYIKQQYMNVGLWVE